MYIGLWSRIEGFERARMTRALLARAVVQGPLRAEVDEEAGRLTAFHR